MKAALHVIDVMTKPVVTVTADTSVEEAVRMMIGQGIGGLPVVDAQGNLAGIVTEGDFLRRVESGTERHRPRWLEFLLGPGRIADEYVHTHSRRIAEVMTPSVVSVSEDTPLVDAVGRMETHRVKRLPVLRDGRIVGIVSRSDLLRALLKSADRPAVMEADARIRERLESELDAQSWVPRSSVTIAVQDGVIDLRGVVFDDRQREALRVMAENISGVRRVRDHLAWVEPNSGFVVEPVEEERKREEAIDV